MLDDRLSNSLSYLFKSWVFICYKSFVYLHWISTCQKGSIDRCILRAIKYKSNTFGIPSCVNRMPTQTANVSSIWFDLRCYQLWQIQQCNVQLRVCICNGPQSIYMIFILNKFLKLHQSIQALFCSHIIFITNSMLVCFILYIWYYQIQYCHQI